MPNPAAVAYEAYRKSLGISKGWQELSDTEWKAWWDVVDAMAKIDKCLGIE